VELALSHTNRSGSGSSLREPRGGRPGGEGAFKG